MGPPLGEVARNLTDRIRHNLLYVNWGALTSPVVGWVHARFVSEFRGESLSSENG
jgi:hypothetical protein